MSELKDEDKPIGSHMVAEAPLQSLLRSIGEDIQRAYNICDAYSEQHLLLKVWKADEWERRFVDCAKTFAGRMQELTWAIANHTAGTVEQNKQTLTAIHSK